MARQNAGPQRNRVAIIAFWVAVVAGAVYLIKEHTASSRISAEEFELGVAHVCNEHQGVKNVTKVLLSRVYNLVAARARRDAPKGQASAAIAQAVLDTFGSKDKGISGGVGMDINALREVIHDNGTERATTRERLSLLYIALTQPQARHGGLPALSGLLTEELDLYRTNRTQYTKWLRRNNLQLDIRLLNATDRLEQRKGYRDLVDTHHVARHASTVARGTRKCYLPHFVPAKGAVRSCKCQPPELACRAVKAEPLEDDIIHVKDVAHPPLTTRELRFQFDNLDKSISAGLVRQTSYWRKPLKWVAGSALYSFPFASRNAVMTTMSRAGHLYRAGPSGTTDQLLRLARYFGLSEAEHLLLVRMACIGWMIPTKDHSFHEIMIAARAHGLSYRSKKYRAAAQDGNYRVTLALLQNKKHTQRKLAKRLRRVGRRIRTKKGPRRQPTGPNAGVAKGASGAKAPGGTPPKRAKRAKGKGKRNAKGKGKGKRKAAKAKAAPATGLPEAKTN